MSTVPWAIYGAYGYTGELIAREAVGRGLAPVLAGRQREPLEALAGELGLASRAFGLDDPQALAEGLAGIGTVVHCAGPFVRTSRPMADACLATGTHYLDITGEMEVFEALLARDGEAKAAGVVLLPGVGFDVVPSDCLALTLARALPDASELDLAFVNERGEWSRGTLKTMIESLPHLGAVRRDGRIVEVPPAWDTMEIELPDVGRRRVMTIPWGDVSTAYHTTGIPDIRVYTGAPPSAVRRLRRLAPLLPLAGITPVKRLLQWWVGRTVTGPSAEVRERARVHLWGRVRNAAGQEVTATLTTPEGYRFTAISAVECAERVTGGRVEPGAWTPARAFGPGFVGELPGVELHPRPANQAATGGAS